MRIYRLQQGKFSTNDMKGKNLGWKNGHLVQVDLGFLDEEILKPFYTYNSEGGLIVNDEEELVNENV